jgi:hypothetical protein
VSVTVPDPTTSVIVRSTGKCTNSIEIPLQTTPAACTQFLVIANAKTILTYKNCETGLVTEEDLSAGGGRLICAYNNPSSYPFFTNSSDGSIDPRGSCTAGRPGCTSTTLFATAGGGGATFRYFECESDVSTTVVVADGGFESVCVRNDVDIQLVSGVGNFTQSSSCTV